MYSFTQIEKTIEIAPSHAVFHVNSKVDASLRHRVDLDVKSEAMTVSDRKGNEIVVMAGQVHQLIEVLKSAETLVSIHIDNMEAKNPANDH